MKQPSRLALLRLSISGQSVIPVLVAAVVVLGLCSGAYFVPLGPTEHVVGAVQKVALGPTKNAWNHVAYVTLGAKTVVVSVPPDTCAAGNFILLERQRRLWGYSVIADPEGCASSAPPAPAGR